VCRHTCIIIDKGGIIYLLKVSEIKNVRTLENPATVEEAITVRRVLDAEPTADVLRSRFGEVAVAAAQENAWNWLHERNWHEYDGSQYARLSEPLDIIVHPPNADGESLMEETEMDLRPEPISFDAEQSKIILSAMRHTAVQRSPEQLDDAIRALDYLSQRAPNPLERLLSGIALDRMIVPDNQRLLQYTYARITRGRNSPHWVTEPTTGSSNQRSHVRYTQELPERA
jgi:hypothetical protein